MLKRQASLSGGVHSYLIEQIERRLSRRVDRPTPRPPLSPYIGSTTTFLSCCHCIATSKLIDDTHSIVRTIDLLSCKPSRLCSSLPYGFYKRTQANLIMSCLLTGLPWQLIKAFSMEFRRSILVPGSHRLSASLSVRQQASVVSQRDVPRAPCQYHCSDRGCCASSFCPPGFLCSARHVSTQCVNKSGTSLLSLGDKELILRGKISSLYFHALLSIVKLFSSDFLIPLVYPPCGLNCPLCCITKTTQHGSQER